MLDTLLAEIDRAKLELNTNGCLYRGHSSTEYKLLPSVFRYEHEINEVNLFYDYKTHVAAVNGESKTNWELILDMQHYGLPTRLLDWSTSFGVALFFALKGNPESPCIWVLNSSALNFNSTKDTTLFDVSTVSDLGGHKGFNAHNVLAGNCGFDLPYAIRPPHGNSRIAAQRGLFTVHTKSRKPLEELCPETVRMIEIPREMIDSLKRYLAEIGIDEYSMFPDQQGLSDYLKKRHRL